jgi:hypothetical protein
VVDGRPFEPCATSPRSKPPVDAQLSKTFAAGKKAAIVATARKLLVVLNTMLASDTDFRQAQTA